jgi:hypothetical protein
MRTIPRAPAQLRLEIRRLWNGAPSPAGLSGAVELSLAGDALAVRAELAQPGLPRIPAAPAGTRVDGLWEYDVVECFLAGAGGRYLELELGASGHFLVLVFRAPRVRESACESLAPRVAHGRTAGGWWATLELPRSVLPAGLRAGNAFAIAAGELLAHSPVPGAFPDFHQPDAWPALRLGP